MLVCRGQCWHLESEFMTTVPEARWWPKLLDFDKGFRSIECAWPGCFSEKWAKSGPDFGPESGDTPAAPKTQIALRYPFSGPKVVPECGTLKRTLLQPEMWIWGGSWFRPHELWSLLLGVRVAEM